MRHYFLSSFTAKNNVGDDAVSICNAYRYATPRELNGKSGWLISIDSIQPLLDQLQAKIVSKLPTPDFLTAEIIVSKIGRIISNAQRATIKPGIFDSFNGMNKEAFKQIIADVFAPYTSYTCIDMRAVHDTVRTSSAYGVFYIYINAAPTGSNDVTLPAVIFDVPIATRTKAYECSWSGLPIVDPRTGYIVGELVENNLYIHHNIAELGTQEEQLLFRRILEKTLNLLSMNITQKASYLEAMQTHRYSADRVKYIQHCAKRVKQESASVSGSLTTAKREVNMLQEQLIKKIREAQALEQRSQSFTDATQSDEIFGKEFDKLRNMKEVIKIEVGVNAIYVFTRILYCKHPNTRNTHEIGAFKITIPTTSSGSVKWENLTRRVSGHKDNQMAPHIWADGSACLGNVDKTFPQLIAQYEFSTVALLAIKFVESVNITDGAGKHLDKWPIASRTN